MSEEQLIKEIKNNPDGFEKIYNRYYQTIFNYCFRRTRNFDTSKDITSETFLKAFLNIHRFKWKGISILSWLYRIATNEINLYYRSKKYTPKLMNESYGEKYSFNTLENLEEERLNAELQIEKHKQFIKVQKAVKELPIKHQEIISLKYFEKLKIKEISSVLNKKEGTIKSLLSRGITQLKQKLERNLS